VPAGSARAAHAAFLRLIGSARGGVLLRAKPPVEDENGRPESRPTTTAPRPPQPPPPLPVVVVHRRPEGSTPVAPPRGRRGKTLGDDPVDGDPAPRALRSAIKQIFGHIAEKRDDDRADDRS
jgi:hypothetical protein